MKTAREHIPLAPYTTFGIGGPARYFIHAESENTVREALSFAAGRHLPAFILGGGSNLLVADEGFPGVVVRIGIAGTEWSEETDRVVLRAGAGEDWDHVVSLAVDRDLAGIECLSGIPGCVGATPVQNVGAYGQEVADTLIGVHAFDRQDESFVDLDREQCGFTYRSSIFNTVSRDRYVVLRVLFRLRRNGEPAIEYPDIQREFEDSTSAPTLHDVREAVRRVRARKSMLIREGDPDSRSAGSFFKNPIVSLQQFDDIVSASGNTGVPHYPVAGTSQKVKVAAAWLIEQSGISKGYTRGAVGISTRHTLALVNRGGGTAAEMIGLAREIQARVADRFGIHLVPEPVFVGFGSPAPL